MSGQLRGLCEEANRNIDELNEFLADADVEPVERIEEWDAPSVEAGREVERRRQEVDTLHIPQYVDARAHTALHRVIDCLSQLEEAVLVETAGDA